MVRWRQNERSVNVEDRRTSRIPGGAAGGIGDDRPQQQSQGYVVPDAFTHGSSAQRVQFFRGGLDSGDLGACDIAGLPAVG